MAIIAIAGHRTPADFLVVEANSATKWPLRWVFTSRSIIYCDTDINKPMADFCLPVKKIYRYFRGFYNKIQDTVRRLYAGMGAHLW